MHCCLAVSPEELPLVLPILGFADLEDRKMPVVPLGNDLSPFATALAALTQ